VESAFYQNLLKVVGLYESGGTDRHIYGHIYAMKVERKGSGIKRRT
jgi:hypothetical protein